MSNQELSSEFDILFNFLMSNQAPSMSEYEKSVLLTQAQEEIVIAAYSGKLNGEPFESSEEVKAYIQDIVETVIVSTPVSNDNQIDNKSVTFQLPDDVWFIVYEQAKFKDGQGLCNGDKRIIVKPVTHDHFDRVSKNPFKGKNKNRVLRLPLSSNKIEIISDYQIDEYLVRYLRQPKPIILEDLSPYDLTINGQSQESESELNSSIHRIILKRAVDIARSVWS